MIRGSVSINRNPETKISLIALARKRSCDHTPANNFNCMPCFHCSEIPKECFSSPSADGQATHSIAEDGFCPNLYKHLFMFFTDSETVSPPLTTVQSLSPSPNYTREQVTKNCWDCQVHLLSINPMKIKKCKEKPAKHSPNVQLSHLAPICATSGPISSFCSFLCYIQADYIILKEAGSLSSMTVFFSIFGF